MKMLFLLFLVFTGTLAIEIPKKQYFSIQSKELILGPERGLLSLVGGEGDWPSFINYAQDIDNTTGLDVTIGFLEPNNSLNYDYYLVDAMDICEVLNIAITEPESPQAQFMIPELIGLYGVRCPITKGIRNLNPYQFPTLSVLEDIGTGMKNFMVKIMDRNNNNTPIITLLTPLNMKYWNTEKEAVTESASSQVFPHLFGFSMTIITYLVMK